MEASIGFLAATLALLAILVLYIGGTAVVLQLVHRLRPVKKEPAQDSSLPASTA